MRGLVSVSAGHVLCGVRRGCLRGVTGSCLYGAVAHHSLCELSLGLLETGAGATIDTVNLEISRQQQYQSNWHATVNLELSVCVLFCVHTRHKSISVHQKSPSCFRYLTCGDNCNNKK